MPDAPDVAAVWEHLRGGTAVTAPLHDRIPGFADHFSEDPSDRDRTVCPAASIVEPQPLREATRWQVPPEDAGRMFADHVLLLNAASQLIAAGAVPDAPATRDRAGVFVTDLLDSDGRHAVIRAVMFERWWTELRRALAAPAAGASPYGLAELEAALRGDAELDLGRVTDDVRAGGQGVVNAARVAAGLGLSGTAVAVNSACASGLAALSMAMQELRAGSLDFALVGGASMGIDPYNQVALSTIGSLSPSGRGRPYDKDADGFVIGTGAVWFALKRLSDAERDRDEIVAVVLECLGTSDGKGRSIIAPSARGRREVLRRAYRAAGVDPRTVQYVEGHGAGSRLGDATELDAIAAELADARRPVTLGSVKGNYGHLKAPAALAGLLKVVLCLRERTIVPTPGLRRPGDLAGFRDGGVRHARRCERWPRDDAAPRRAGLNAFGLGGTNYHAIVEEYVPRRPDAGRHDTGIRISAATREQLARRVEDAGEAGNTGCRGVAGHDGRAGGAGDGVAGLGEWRAALIPGNRMDEPACYAQLAAEIRGTPASSPGKVTQIGAWSGPDARTGPAAMLFPGQAGTRHFGAVSGLARRLPAGATVLRQVEGVLGERGRVIRRALESGDLRDLGALRGRSGTSQILGLVAATLVARWFRDRTCATLLAVGHSAGEFGALVAGGSLRLEDALWLCWTRGELAEQVVDGRRGLMAALFAGPAIVEELVEPVPGAYLATVNGPDLCVVAGWADAVGRVIERAAERHVDSSRLDISVPFHTPLLAAAVDGFRRTLARVELGAPEIPVYSAVLGGPYSGGAIAMREAIAKLYVEPVRLDRLVRAAAAAGARRFVECGVGRSLGRAVGAVLAGVPHVAIAGASDAADLDRLAAGLWVTGLDRDDRPAAPATAATSPGAGATRATGTAAGTGTGTGTGTGADRGYRAFTAVAVPAGPYSGEPWEARRVLVAVAAGGARFVAAALAAELAGARARVKLAVISELADGSTRPVRGTGAPGTGAWEAGARSTGTWEAGAQEAEARALAAREVAALLSGGGWSVIWVSVPGVAVRCAAGAAGGERVVRELAALRTVAAGLSTGWARSGMARSPGAAPYPDLVRHGREA
jgi:acyl transferase domain-containing protein